MKGFKIGGHEARVLAGREAYLLALQEHWPMFWHALNAAWRTPDRLLMPAALEQWAREYTRHEPWITEMANATLAYWEQNPQSPEARLMTPASEQWFVYWRPYGPTELFKPDLELMGRARITARLDERHQGRSDSCRA